MATAWERHENAVSALTDADLIFARQWIGGRNVQLAQERGYPCMWSAIGDVPQEIGSFGEWPTERELFEAIAVKLARMRKALDVFVPDVSL